MKKLIFTITILLVQAQNFAQSCCSTEFVSNDGNMSVFMKDKTFVDTHLSPLDYKHTSLVGGEMITFKTADTLKANAYFVKSKVKTNNYLFVYQEWWGLNDYVKKEADNLFEKMNGKVNVIAIDMYDGKVATVAEEAGKLMQGANEKRLENIVNGAIGFAGKKAKIASIGWCFGGGWALKSAILEKKQAIGAVMYYGMPVKDVEKLKTLNCDVLGLFATEKWISKETIEEFAANMKTANRKLDYTIYEAAHAFANPSNPKFDEKVAAIANEKAVVYLKDKFKI